MLIQKLLNNINLSFNNKNKVITASIALKAKLKNSIKKLFSLLNIHAELHFINIIYKYTIIINVNILGGKLKHKTFK